LPDIIALYETVEGREEHKEWKACPNATNASERPTEPLNANFRRGLRISPLRKNFPQK
jgi:hypothetical protein